MEMPKPTAGHKKIEILAGSWKGEERMHPSEWDPKGGVAKAKIDSRIGLDGFYVIGDYEQSRDGKVTFRGHSITGYQADSGEVVMHWFDSMGMGVDVFRGKFAGDVLTLQAENPMGKHRLTYDFKEKGTIRSKMEMSKDGKTWKAMFDGVYHR